VEPDWRRFPGWADVTGAQWRDVQWQRLNCIKNAKQLHAIVGNLLADRFYADLVADQEQMATMSMLLPPQMLNTMAPTASAAKFTDSFMADPVRRYMLPVRSDRDLMWPSHPHSMRDSLREAEMWVVEGLTHRYPTKVLAELLSTCPQYCGHCTRMDLVGNSTAQVDKHKLVLKPVDRQEAMIDYLKRTPSVRDVVVSGGDVANVPWKQLETFLMRLLDIESVRDIRLATKALAGLPQHWLQADILVGLARVATVANWRAVNLAVHTHVNHAQSVTPLVAEAARAALDAGVRDVRNQGVLMRGVNATPEALLDLCFALQDEANIPAILLLHVRHDPQRQTLATCSVGSPGPTARHHGLPARLRNATHRLRRAIRGQAMGSPGRRVQPPTGHLLLEQELPHAHRHRRTRRPAPSIPVLRPHRDPPAVRRRVVAPTRGLGLHDRPGPTAIFP
jgi:lysine 2,3-aminomutase